MIKTRIDADLKQALLGGDKALAETLRGIKSAILYVEVEKRSRDEGLSDEEIILILQKEAKKRQESADMYTQNNAADRAEKELSEKKVIEQYLPEQMDDETLGVLVNQAAEANGGFSQQNMGKIIAAVKQNSAGQADGSRIANKVKEMIQES